MKPIQPRRSQGARRAIGWFALVACALSAPAWARTRTGGAVPASLIVASGVYLRPTAFDSVATLVAAMHLLHQPQPFRTCGEGAWRVHFVAQLERPPGEDALTLGFNEISDSGDGRRLFSSAVPVRPESATVFVDDFVVSKELGFAPGHTYEVSLSRSGEPDHGVLARGTFMLK